MSSSTQPGLVLPKTHFRKIRAWEKLPTLVTWYLREVQLGYNGCLTQEKVLEGDLFGKKGKFFCFPGVQNGIVLSCNEVEAENT